MDVKQKYLIGYESYSFRNEFFVILRSILALQFHFVVDRCDKVYRHNKAYIYMSLFTEMNINVLKVTSSFL